MSRKYKFPNWILGLSGDFTRVHAGIQLKNGRFVGYGHKIINEDYEWLILGAVKDRNGRLSLVASNFEETLLLNPDLCS